MGHKNAGSQGHCWKKKKRRCDTNEEQAAGVCGQKKKTRPHIVKSGFSAVSLGNILKSTCENIPDIELCFASYILKLWTRQKLLEVALYWSSHSHRIPVQSRLWQINDPVGEIKNRTLKHKQEI